MIIYAHLQDKKKEICDRVLGLGFDSSRTRLYSRNSSIYVCPLREVKTFGTMSLISWKHTKKQPNSLKKAVDGNLLIVLWAEKYFSSGLQT